MSYIPGYKSLELHSWLQKPQQQSRVHQQLFLRSTRDRTPARPDERRFTVYSSPTEVFATRIHYPKSQNGHSTAQLRAAELSRLQQSLQIASQASQGYLNFHQL